MARYVFSCDEHGSVEVHADIHTGPGSIALCPTCGDEMYRNYKAEDAGFVGLLQMKHDREAGGLSNRARLTLPTNDEFKGPNDPDGTKGMREWRENHEPKDSNKKPFWPGDVEKKVFATGGK